MTDTTDPYREEIVTALVDAMTVKPSYGGPQHNTPGSLPLTASPEEFRRHKAGKLADAVREVRDAELERATRLLGLATVLEIPRPGTGIPLQLRLSHGHTNRWAICDREGRRWHREHGWVYEESGIRDEALRDATRYTLDEAETIARELAGMEKN
jgi:hypothetical protein